MRRCCNLSLEWDALFQPPTKASLSISVWMKQGKCFTSACWGEYNSCGVHDPTRIFGVYTSILDCSKGKEKHMLGYISDDKPCGVADTNLVVDIPGPTFSVKVDGDVKERWVSKLLESWQVGWTMPWLWLLQQFWESNSDLTMDKYPKCLLCTIKILHLVTFATDMCARVLERLLLSMQSWINDCWMLYGRCCSFVVSWLSETRDGWSFVLDKLLWDRKRFRRGRHRLGVHM